jgi:predicted phage terminase large subunit-like protein
MDDIVLHDLFLGSDETRPDEDQPLKEQCRYSLKLFCETYLKHWFYAPWCGFHLEIIQMLEDLTFAKTRRKQYTAVASPRKHAKTTIVSKAYSLWLICYKHEPNIVLIADTIGQSCEYLDDVKNEIESNDLLIADFGNLMGKLWRNNQITTANEVTITCKGTGSKIRGMAKRGRRPGIFIMDELENDEFVENANIRKKLRSWLTKAVIPSSCETGKFFIIGTIMHEDSLLNNLLNSKEFSYWKRYFYQAVQEFSESPLWDEWVAIMENEESNDSEEQAYQFYKDHRDEMLKGVKALWMDNYDDYYYDMMVMKWSDPDAFSSEEMNVAISPENQTFTAELLDSVTFDDIPCKITEIKIGVDPSLGKSKKSDLSSICAVARGENGKLYVIDVDAKRRKVDILVEDVFSMAMKYNDKLSKINIEANGLQHLFLEQFVMASEKTGVYFAYEGIKTDSNKEIKIQALAPKMKQGSLKIHRRLKTLRNELLAFPKGKTDDIMDSVCLAIDGAFTSSGFCFTSLPGSRESHRHVGINNFLNRRR